MARVISVYTTPAGENPMGEVTGGVLTLRGTCISTTIRGQTNDLVLRGKSCNSIMPLIPCWYPDYEGSTRPNNPLSDERDDQCEDQDAVMIRIGSSEREAYFLVLIQVEVDECPSYQRVGIATAFVFNTSLQYGDMSEKTVMII